MSVQEISSTSSHPKYRLDIDGLRAIAVLAVVIFHAFPDWLKGGFIGVDIFFVLSGFLISTIIFNNLEQDKFSFIDFYSRRIKRIFPSLLLVLVVCLVFGWFALLPDEYKQLSKHTVAGVSFVSNLVLWSESGYFDISGNVKPLLHLWSLGVEEQFYIIWPFLLWFAWRRKLNLFIVTISIALASFIFNNYQVKLNPVAAFYSPEMRFWELLSGSLLAWVMIYKPNLFELILDKFYKSLFFCSFNAASKTSQYIKNLFSLAGLLLIAFGFWAITETTVYPGKWALVPVMGSVLLIAVGPNAWINKNILSNKIMVGFGLISYPLYLWHWPLLAFARIIQNGTPSYTARIIIVLTSILLAWLTYKFIELPIRFGKHSKTKIIVLVASMFTLGFISLSLYFFKASTDINTTQLSYKFPQTEGCSNKYPYAKSTCYESEHKYAKTIVIIGDSHAQALTYGFKSIFDNNNLKYNVLSVGKGGCHPFLNTNTVSFIKKSYDCDTIITPAIYDAVNRKDVEWVILVGRHAWRYSGKYYGELEKESKLKPSTFSYNSGTLNTQISTEVFKLGLIDTINSISKNRKKLIFVHQLPELGFDPRQCLGRFSQFKSTLCDLDINVVNQRLNPYKETANKILENKENIYQYDPIHFVCSKKKCKPFIENGFLFYQDDDHMSKIGSEYIAKDILEKIIKQ